MSSLASLIANRPRTFVDSEGRVIYDSVDYLEVRLEYDGSNNPIYIGWSRPGAGLEGDLVWQIAKLAYDGSNNLTSVKWPQNSGGIPTAEFQFSWTARATYTYS